MSHEPSASLDHGSPPPAAGGPPDREQPILAVRDLSVSYRSPLGAARVVDGVDLSLHPHRTLALVGESGSGKTTVARAIVGLVRPPTGSVEGSIVYQGEDLLQMRRRKAADVYGRDIAMIFQEPMRSLNPAYSVGDQIAEVVRRHEGVSRREAWKRAVEAMDHVRIARAAERARSYPFQFSGGMCQRIMIAMAIVCRPAILIADEPTTALDVTVQAQVLDLLKEQQDELGLAMLFITHDLGVVADVADEVMVLYAGQVVEHGAAAPVFRSPRHPYTAGLLDSIPAVIADDEDLGFIPGRVPSVHEYPPGCRFQDRCGHARAICRTAIPLDEVDQREVRCVRASELQLEGVRRG